MEPYPIFQQTWSHSNIFSRWHLFFHPNLCEHDFQRAAPENISLYLAPNRGSPCYMKRFRQIEWRVLCNSNTFIYINRIILEPSGEGHRCVSPVSNSFYFIRTCTGYLPFQGFCPIFNTCEESNGKRTHAITHQQRMTFVFQRFGSFTAVC